MKPAIGIGVALLALALVGCGTVAQSGVTQTTIPVLNDVTHKKLTVIPASLGLLAPQVVGYHCGGDYEPAQPKKLTADEILTEQPINMMPLWQLTLRCVNPHLKFHLPKGNMRPGMVWAFEFPVGLGEPLREAAKHISGVTDMHFMSLGNVPVMEGKMGHYNDLEFVQGKTTWIGRGQRHTGAVLIQLTGRAVPMSVLERFAKSLHPLSSRS